MSRGSSAIIDEFQSMLVMSKKKGEPVALVTHEKDRELGQEVADFGLRIEDVSERADGSGDPKWGLRVVHVDREQMKLAPDPAKIKFERAKQTVLQALEQSPGVAGVGALCTLLKDKCERDFVRAALDTLEADGTVVKRHVSSKKGGRAVRLYRSVDSPTEAQ
jgi:hypothetical protein